MPNPYGLPEFKAPTSQAEAAAQAIAWARATGSRRAVPQMGATSWEDYSAVPKGPMSAQMLAKDAKEGWTRDPVKGWGKTLASGKWGQYEPGSGSAAASGPPAATGFAAVTPLGARPPVAPSLGAPMSAAAPGPPAATGFAAVTPLGARPATPVTPPLGAPRMEQERANEALQLGAPRKQPRKQPGLR